MTRKHTPGPWPLVPCPNSKDGYQIPSVIYADREGNIEIDAADAFLISAAPDLLEALQELFDADMEHVLMGDGKDDQIAAIAKARAAIAKATGEDQTP